VSLLKRLLDWRTTRKEDAPSIAAEQDRASASGGTDAETRVDDVQAIIDAGTGTGFTGAAPPSDD
jgi:hypothetical protein